MFGDFQCHDCDRFVKYTEPQINSTYIKPGKVALVFAYIFQTRDLILGLQL